MRKIKFALLGLLLLIGSSSFAQINFGLKGGLNVSNFHVRDNDYIDRHHLKPGVSFGAFARVPIIPKMFSIQPEVMFSQKGAKYSVNQTGTGRGEVALRTTYLDVPLLAMVNVGKFNVFAGPQASFLFNAKQMTEGSLFNVADGTQDVSKRFKSVDYGAVAGIGFDFKPVMLNFRYNLGLSKVYNGAANDANTFGYGNARNQVAQVQIGFMF